MDGVHDLGGMHGFGPIEVDEESFHEAWERTVFAIDRILRSQRVYNVDEKRHAIERMAPAEYLAATYFERWLVSLQTLLTERGVVTETELADRTAQHTDSNTAVPNRTDPDIVAQVRAAFESRSSLETEPVEPLFDAGVAVVVRNIHPKGHTRCPRYVRRAHGIIKTVRGTFPLPDAKAHNGNAVEPLYTVRFSANELWEDSEDDKMYVDLWESYLEPSDDTMDDRRER
jgi:nitrile hydratase beta subunit